MENDALIEVRGLSFEYAPGARALDNVDLTFKAGEFAVITGPSGCGKSTLAKCLVGLIPHDEAGAMAGSVVVAGRDTRDHAPCRLADLIALSFQCPDDQIFSNSVEADMAFGPEHMGLDVKEIESRISRALCATGAEYLRGRLADELSGGEKQRVAIASSLAMMPEALVLDEPTSELDPSAAFGLIDMLHRLNKEHHVTIVLMEHRLERLYGVMDRLIVLDRGRVALDGTPGQVFEHDLRGLGITEPPAVTFRKKFKAPDAGNGWRASYKLRAASRGESVISLRDVSFSYPRSGKYALEDVSLDIYRGELAMVMGANGSGKTTLIKHFNGLLRPDGGKVAVGGRDIADKKVSSVAREVGVVFQNPARQLFAESVRDELAFGPRSLGITGDEAGERINGVARPLGLSGLLSRSPFALSCGEKQRVAIGSVLTMRPSAVVLDEPTLGLNQGLKDELADLLTGLKASGHAVVVATNDVEFAASYADRVIVMREGRIIKDGGPRETLTADAIVFMASLHLPQATSIGRSLGLDGILDVDEIVRGTQACTR